MRSTQPESGAAICETVTLRIATVKVSAGVASVVAERPDDDLWGAAVKDSATPRTQGARLTLL